MKKLLNVHIVIWDLITDKVNGYMNKNVKKLKILQKKFKFNIIELDLTDTNKLYKELSKLKIDILFANAGIGRGAEGILKASRDDIEISTKININTLEFDGSNTFVRRLVLDHDCI